MAVFALAILVSLVTFAGVWLVCENYPLSADEFLAGFDAQIFRSGRLAAPVPVEWRDYLPALQPVFLLGVPHKSFWVSSYLPVNAAFRALGAALGSEQAVNPIWAGLSVIATYGVARQLWPDRRGRAFVATLLLATSSQFLLAAMTPYSMSAHLALNLVWLWLILKGGWPRHVLAAVVAFLACGLHQLVFNAVFAAPFVLQMWLDRRWRLALWHTAAYGVICLFWIYYWPILFTLLGVQGVATSGASRGLGGFFGTVLGLVRQFNPLGLLLMAENLVRFATWQSLLTIPLALFAVRFAIRSSGPLRSLLFGPVLMLLVTLVVLPSQGPGWGYRYLHGFLGSTCLLAAWGWDKLCEDSDGAARKTAHGVFAVASIASVLLFPVRAWQANRYIRPYAAAERAIRNTKADIVLLDHVGTLYGWDLVRNDPWLKARPMVLMLRALDRAQIRRLCEKNSVALFSSQAILSYGIRSTSAFPGRVDAEAQKAVPLSPAPVCGR